MEGDIFYLYIFRKVVFSTSAVCYIKIYAEMTEILQVKDCSFYIHWCQCFLTGFFTSSH